MAAIRMDTRNLNTTHSFNESDAKALVVYAMPETFDLNTYRPTLDATARHNYVELMAKKLGVDSLNLYWRPVGTADWKLLAAKCTRFPFQDDMPPPAGQTMRIANTWRWEPLATTKSAIRATSPAQCSRARHFVFGESQPCKIP